ncbi:MAG: glycosyltransferase family 2 protein [Bacteroidales bacterium]|nr:glycosyltransferase family 2 protein [Bacteroidales bacterium]
MKISIIIPVFNAEKTICLLVDEVSKELSAFDYEIVLINDGSKDKSAGLCEKLSLKSENIVFISLHKNFGEHNAVMCGLNYCSGDYAIVIDDDFQNPPSEIIKLYNEANKGYDVVYSKYLEKKHNVFRNLGSRFNNFLASILLPVPKNLYLSSFKCISRDIINEINKYKGPFPYIDGLIFRVTNNYSTVIVEHKDSLIPKSNYTFHKLVSLWMNMLLNFSVLPLRIFTISGFIVFVLGVILSLFFIIDKLFFGEPAGWTSIIIAILTFSGFQIVFLGLISEYLGKQYLDQNKTPQWSIKKLINAKKDIS